MFEVVEGILRKDWDPRSESAHLSNEEISYALVGLFVAWCLVGYAHTFLPFERLGMDKGQKADS